MILKEEGALNKCKNCGQWKPRKTTITSSQCPPCGTKYWQYGKPEIIIPEKMRQFDLDSRKGAILRAILTATVNRHQWEIFNTSPKIQERMVDNIDTNKSVSSMLIIDVLLKNRYDLERIHDSTDLEIELEETIE